MSYIFKTYDSFDMFWERMQKSPHRDGSKGEVDFLENLHTQEHQGLNVLNMYWNKQMFTIQVAQLFVNSSYIPPTIPRWGR